MDTAAGCGVGPARLRLPALGGWKNHIYAAYCCDDHSGVEPIISFLEDCQLRVYNPRRDEVPGRSVFWNCLDNGIHASKITLVFLTKNFVRNRDCLYQAENAVRHAISKKGQHRVICVMLTSCKVPRYLRQFNCVYTWRYWQEPSDAHLRILKAVLAPQEKYRPLMCSAIRNRAFPVYSSGSKCTHVAATRDDKLPCRKTVLGYLTVLTNVNKVKTALQNCSLVCTTSGCTFSCSGINILTFYNHVKSDCKHLMVDCPDCRQKIKRGRLKRHLSRCKHRKQKCLNEGCRQMLKRNQVTKHGSICSYREEVCPNKRLGCDQVFDIKDTGKHLEICEFEYIACETCSEKFLRYNLENHLCGYEIMRCKNCGVQLRRMDMPCHEQTCKTTVTCRNYGCGETVSKGLLLRHELQCEFAAYSCHNPGCGRVLTKGTIKQHERVCDYRQEPCANCGRHIPVKDMRWHNRECVKMVKCDKCGMTLPSSGKLIHDRWVCVQQGIQSLCVGCRTCVQHSRLPAHEQHCPALDSDQPHAPWLAGISVDNDSHSTHGIHGGGPSGPDMGDSGSNVGLLVENKHMTTSGQTDKPSLDGPENILLAYLVASEVPEPPSRCSRAIADDDPWNFNVKMTPKYQRLFSQMDRFVIDYQDVICQKRVTCRHH